MICNGSASAHRQKKSNLSIDGLAKKITGVSWTPANINVMMLDHHATNIRNLAICQINWQLYFKSQYPTNRASTSGSGIVGAFLRPGRNYTTGAGDQDRKILPLKWIYLNVQLNKPPHVQ